MPILVEAVKNDSFLGPMTAGSGNPDFLWSQPLPQVKPVLLVPQSCLEVQWLGHNRCPISWCVLNFVASDSNNKYEVSISLNKCVLFTISEQSALARVENWRLST